MPPLAAFLMKVLSFSLKELLRCFFTRGCSLIGLLLLGLGQSWTGYPKCGGGNADNSES